MIPSNEGHCMYGSSLLVHFHLEGRIWRLHRALQRTNSKPILWLNAWEARALVAIVLCATVHYGCDCAIAHIYQQSSIS